VESVWNRENGKVLTSEELRFLITRWEGQRYTLKWKKLGTVAISKPLYFPYPIITNVTFYYSG
jgi:hypothetical protein